MVPGDVVRDSETDARSENAKASSELGRYIVALALFRCFGRPFALDRRQRAHKNPDQCRKCPGHNLVSFKLTSKLAVATRKVPGEDLLD